MQENIIVGGLFIKHGYSQVTNTIKSLPGIVNTTHGVLPSSLPETFSLEYNGNKVEFLLKRDQDEVVCGSIKHVGRILTLEDDIVTLLVGGALHKIKNGQVMIKSVSAIIPREMKGDMMLSYSIKGLRSQMCNKLFIHNGWSSLDFYVEASVHNDLAMTLSSGDTLIVDEAMNEYKTTAKFLTGITTLQLAQHKNITIKKIHIYNTCCIEVYSGISFRCPINLPEGHLDLYNNKGTISTYYVSEHKLGDDMIVKHKLCNDIYIDKSIGPDQMTLTIKNFKDELVTVKIIHQYNGLHREIKDYAMSKYHKGAYIITIELKARESIIKTFNFI